MIYDFDVYNYYVFKAHQKHFSLFLFLFLPIQLINLCLSHSLPCSLSLIDHVENRNVGRKILSYSSHCFVVASNSSPFSSPESNMMKVNEIQTYCSLLLLYLLFHVYVLDPEGHRRFPSLREQRIECWESHWIGAHSIPDQYSFLLTLNVQINSFQRFSLDSMKWLFMYVYECGCVCVFVTYKLEYVQRSHDVHL